MNPKQSETIPMTSRQEQAVQSLNAAQLQQIDEAIMRNVISNWRKVSRVVGTALVENSEHIKDIPDLFYAQRIGMLAATGKLEITGDALDIRHTEVRLPTKA
ncbi:DUF3658 domain-containing protein [Burkholderia sp. WSM2232]|uniref:DUF3658 domain-containing protein n=1 Tax=Burkholderia sp. WSM2232 TaxID=944436 RepID=UPI0009FE6F04|nr:DUF3658 domain-containing protein [Burkholderia sp. WSM2232]